MKKSIETEFLEQTEIQLVTQISLSGYRCETSLANLLVLIDFVMKFFQLIFQIVLTQFSHKMKYQLQRLTVINSYIALGNFY